MKQRVLSSLKKLFEPDLNSGHYLLLLPGIFIAFFLGMGSYALENMNEGLYAEIPREMLMMHIWIIPHLNYVPYLEKPPLLYWLTALSYSIFGISAFSARLIPALSAAVICLGLFLFAKAFNRARAGWLAAMILASSIGFIFIARVLIFDMLLTACFTLSLLFFYFWYKRSTRLFLRLFYLFVGLAFMTKGLLAPVLIFTITGVFMLSENDRKQKLLGMLDLPGIFLFLLMVVPWVVVASWQQPYFFTDFFINEQILRFLNKRIPADYHTGPIYFYLPWIVIYLLPWSLFFPLLFRKSMSLTLKPLRKFLWLWFTLTFIFFSLSQAKASYYLVLGVPPLALLLGMQLDEYFKTDKIILLTSVLVAVIFIALAATGTLYLAANVPAVGKWLPDFSLPAQWNIKIGEVWMGILLYAFLASLIIRYAPSPVALFLLLAGLTIPVIALYLTDKQGMQSQRSAVAIADFVKKHAAQRPVYLYRDYEKISTVLFYLQKRLPIIDSQSNDLYFGSRTPQANGWFITAKDFARDAQNQAVYVVMLSENLIDFQAALQPTLFCEVSQSGDTLLLTNQPAECVKKGVVTDKQVNNSTPP